MLALLGSTGYTGALVLDRVRALGLTVRLIGRSRDALGEQARPGDEVRIADARDESALREAFDGAGAVISLAGPFTEVGDAPVRAAIAAGAHYVDTSGEQQFARLVYERYDEPARERGVTLLTSFGFDYVPGDLAARLAADGFEPVDEIVVAYSVRGTATSSGTRKTIGRVMAQPHAAFANGVVIESRFGATTRRVEFPFGARDVVEWGGTEPLTVPRHTQVQNVRSYIRAPRLAARFGAAGRLAAPLVRLTGAIGSGPSARKRATSRFVVVAESRRSAPRGRRVSLAGSDVYGLTAALVAEAARALQGGEVQRAGALAPAEAFEPRALIDRVAPLLRIEAEQEL